MGLKIAFFVQVHRQPELVERLAGAIYNDRDLFAVHVDAKVDGRSREELKNAFPPATNVITIPALDVIWGGWSQCDSQLRSIRALCESGREWDYFVNLSGQDYPIRPVEELRDFLANADGSNFIEVLDWQAMSDEFRGVVARRKTWVAIELLGRVRRLPLRTVRATRDQYRYAGSSWFMLTRSFCEWICAYGYPIAERFRYTRNCDEAYMQHVIAESPFFSTVDGNIRRYFSWAGGASPRVLKSCDFAEIRSSKDFFARKFNLPESGGLLDLIDAQLLGS